MKEYVIRNAQKESRIQLISCKAGLKKIRQYRGKKNKKNTSDSNDDDEPTLPTLNPTTYHDCERMIQELITKGPLQEFSSPSKERYTSTLSVTKTHLAKATLISVEHQAIQTKLYEESKRKATSRRRIHKGGEVEVDVTREKKRKRDAFEKSEAIRKAQKHIEVDKNKSKNVLHVRGVRARKEEKARKLTIQQLRANGEIVPFNMALLIRDPEKDPTQADLDSLLLNPSEDDSCMNLDGLDPDSSDDGQSILSIDSITWNVDFISFGY